LDEIENKRVSNFFEKQKGVIYKILKSIKDSDSLINEQESFMLNNLKNIHRFNSLINEMYKDETLILISSTENERFPKHMSIINVGNKRNLSTDLHSITLQILGANYIVTNEKSMYPSCLSFAGGGMKLFLLNYSNGVINTL
jgi:hypothetical protein